MDFVYDNQNVFAKILRSEIPCDKVFENEQALVFKDINPQAPVHFMVIPKGPYVSFDHFARDATADEQVGFFAAFSAACDLSGVNDGFRAIANTRTHGVQDVPHFHLHVLGGRPLGRMLPELI